jgi:hypothetical protein
METRVARVYLLPTLGCFRLLIILSGLLFLVFIFVFRTLVARR